MKNFRRRPLDGDSADRLLNAALSHKEKLAVITLLDTGLRVNEFTGLVPADIFWQRGYIVVKGKGSKERQVPLTERVRLLLEAHFALSNEIGMTDTTVNNLLKRMAERAGVQAKVTAHVLRHTFAVQALIRGVDIRSLQLVMGHSSIEVTALYLRFMPENVLASFRKAGWVV